MWPLRPRRRAVVLDPLALESHTVLARTLYSARRYEEAVAAFAEGISLDPGFKALTGIAGSPITGSGTCRARAPHARRIRTTGQVNGVSR